MSVSGNLKAPLAELVGTFAFVFIGAGAICTDAYTSGAVGLVGIALAHGSILAVMVSSFGSISGGHFNPAVSTAFVIARRIKPTRWVTYVAAQLFGAVLAGFALRTIFSSVFPGALTGPAHLGAPSLGENVSFGTAVFVEALLTFFLVTAVYGMAVDERAPRTIAGFGIGLTFGLDILMGGPLTGAAMNPARSFGPAVTSGFFDNHLVYWIGPIVGGALAALLYENVFIQKPEER